MVDTESRIDEDDDFDARAVPVRTQIPVRPPGAIPLGGPRGAAVGDVHAAARAVAAPKGSPFGDTNVVFFGNGVPVECQRCGAFCSTSIGHKYCSHVTCPIALKEFKRRKRKRTSTLEQVYFPQIHEPR